MERQSIAQDTLLEILLSQTGKALGKDASYLGDRIEFIRREGAPNWDATIKIASLGRCATGRQFPYAMPGLTGPPIEAE